MCVEVHVVLDQHAVVLRGFNEGKQTKCPTSQRLWFYLYFVSERYPIHNLQNEPLTMDGCHWCAPLLKQTALHT